MQRRHLIYAHAALSALASCSQAQGQQVQPGALVPGTYASFEEWAVAARESSLQFLNTPAGRDPDFLIRFLALWSAALPSNPDAWQTPWVELPGANTRLEFNTLSGGRPFVVSAFRMAPGCLLPAHCHPGGGGITLCLQGSVTLEHFNLEPGSTDFRQTGGAASVLYESAAHLRPGLYTWFTPNVSNLHQLRAGPQGATGVDLVVQWEGAGEFSFLKFNERNMLHDAAIGRIFTGTWSGMNISEAYG